MTVEMKNKNNRKKMLLEDKEGGKSDLMLCRSHESIVSKVAADICLDHFAADPLTIKEVVVCSLRIISGLVASGHFVRGRRRSTRNCGNPRQKIYPRQLKYGGNPILGDVDAGFKEWMTTMTI